jgi:hypothetical protein
LPRQHQLSSALTTCRIFKVQLIELDHFRLLLDLIFGLA